MGPGSGFQPRIGTVIPQGQIQNVLSRTAVSDKIRIASTSKITKETRAVTAKIKVRKAASPKGQDDQSQQVFQGGFGRN